MFSAVFLCFPRGFSWGRRGKKSLVFWVVFLGFYLKHQGMEDQGGEKNHRYEGFCLFFSRKITWTSGAQNPGGGEIEKMPSSRFLYEDLISQPEILRKETHKINKENPHKNCEPIQTLTTLKNAPNSRFVRDCFSGFQSGELKLSKIYRSCPKIVVFKF